MLFLAIKIIVRQYDYSRHRCETFAYMRICIRKVNFVHMIHASWRY